MYTLINFISFVILTFISLRMGDPVGIVLCLIGFTIMLVPCEEMDLHYDNHNNKYKLGET